MSYEQGTINSPTPAAAMMTVLDTIIDAHPAWEFVEQVVSASATARVYRNIGSVSHAMPGDADFFLVISRDTDAGQVRFSICESWDAGGKLLVRYAPAASTVAGAGSYQAIAADGSVGATGQAFTSPNVMLATPADALVINTTIPYYISVTAKRVCYAHRSVGWVYAGAYDPLPGYYDPFPLVLLSNGIAPGALGYDYSGASFRWWRGSGYNWSTMVSNGAGAVGSAHDYWCGSFTRQWRTVVQAATGWAVRPYIFEAINPLHGAGWLPLWNQREPLTGRFYPGRIGLNQAHFTLNGATPNNDDCRGVLADVLQCDPMDTYPANGDSMIVNGAEWVCMCRSQQTQFGEHFWVSKAA